MTVLEAKASLIIGKLTLAQMVIAELFCSKIHHVIFGMTNLFDFDVFRFLETK
jgi:hypothetical protein